MALDAALMESVRAGADPVLRFYRWSPPCLSLGRNQPAAGLYDEAALAARGIEVVRRPTGGRAVLHDRELTYSVVMPDRTLGPPRAAYAAINRALVRGLRRLGVGASLQPATGTHPAPPSLAPCFRDPAEGEIMVDGRKLVGSAQFREAGVTLQHGSLLLEGDQAAVVDLLLAPPRVADENHPATLSDYLSPLPSWQELVESLADGWRDEVAGSIDRTAPAPGEADRAAELTADYAAPGWTWRS